MKEIKDRLQEALQIRNISRSELSDQSGVPKPMITDYIKGRYKPKQDNIYAMSKALRVNPAWFMGYEDADINDLSYLEQNKKDTGNPDLNTELYEKYSNIKPIATRRIPMLGEIACGKPIFVDEDRESYVAAGTDIKADFCMKAHGDSMINARILDGDIVFIRRQDMVNDGDIAVVVIEDEATLKRVYYDRENNVLQLVAENPKYRPLVYSGEELENIRILGKAVAFESSL